MKQKKTVDAGSSAAKPSIRKVGTILGSGALTVITIGTICVFGLTSPSVTQKDTKAAITNTTTAAVSEKKESTYTSVDTVVWRKASIDEYDISQVTTVAAETSKASASKSAAKSSTVKETKTDNVKMYASDIVNLRKKADKNSDSVATINKDESVTVTAETSNGWYAVKYGDYSGYVMQEYFTKTVPESVKSAETTKAETALKKETSKTSASKETAQTTTKKTTVSQQVQAASGDSPVISYTDEEFEMLCYVLQGEVGNCSEESKVAVANVVINRVKSSQFPNSIEGVLTANNQFTAINGYYNRTTVPSQNTIDCAKRALFGEDNTNGAIFYYAPQYCGGSTAAWFETLNFCMELDGQRYFKNW